MKNKVLLFISIFFMINILFERSNVHAEEINILFIGNSYTFRHDMPLLVKTILELGDSSLTVNYYMHPYGGRDIFRHSELYQSGDYIKQSSMTVEDIDQSIAKMDSLLSLTDPPAFFTDYVASMDGKQTSGMNDWGNMLSNIESAKGRHLDLRDDIANNNAASYDCRCRRNRSGSY